MGSLGFGHSAWDYCFVLRIFGSGIFFGHLKTGYGGEEMKFRVFDEDGKEVDVFCLLSSTGNLLIPEFSNIGPVDFKVADGYTIRLEPRPCTCGLLDQKVSDLIRLTWKSLYRFCPVCGGEVVEVPRDYSVPFCGGEVVEIMEKNRGNIVEAIKSAIKEVS